VSKYEQIKTRCQGELFYEIDGFLSRKGL